METIKRLEPVWLFMVLVGAANWAVISLFDTNVLSEIFGTGTLTDVVYVVVGFAALTFLPKLMDEMAHFGDYVRPHRA